MRISLLSDNDAEIDLFIFSKYFVFWLSLNIFLTSYSFLGWEMSKLARYDAYLRDLSLSFCDFRKKIGTYRRAYSRVFS